ncbi:MAG TPA: hypothetical protein VFC67_13390 [Prolixibacteraceae bacterium]|nr:hypothetical protein [Prolixibacteraceae bacterium]
MKKLVLILSFVFALGLFSVDAMSNKKVVNNQPVKTEQTAKKSVKKPAVKKVVKNHKSTKKAQTTVKK